MHSSAGIPCGMGFPIGRFSHQSLVAGSARLIAGSYVLHRLSTPRHPPSALTAWSCRPDPDGKTGPNPALPLAGFCMVPASTFPHRQTCTPWGGLFLPESISPDDETWAANLLRRSNSNQLRFDLGLLVITAPVFRKTAGGRQPSDSCLSIMTCQRAMPPRRETCDAISRFDCPNLDHRSAIRVWQARRPVSGSPK